MTSGISHGITSWFLLHGEHHVLGRKASHWTTSRLVGLISAALQIFEKLMVVQDSLGDPRSDCNEACCIYTYVLYKLHKMEV